MSNVKLPQKAGFVPTVGEWDALVRIAENLAAQVVQAQQDAHHWATLANSAANERGAARHEWGAAADEAAELRLEVARLTAALSEYGWHLDGCPAADCSTTMCECGYTALRKPAPATAKE